MDPDVTHSIVVEEFTEAIGVVRRKDLGATRTRKDQSSLYPLFTQRDFLEVLCHLVSMDRIDYCHGDMNQSLA